MKCFFVSEEMFPVYIRNSFSNSNFFPVLESFLYCFTCNVSFIIWKIFVESHETFHGSHFFHNWKLLAFLLMYLGILVYWLERQPLVWSSVGSNPAIYNVLGNLKVVRNSLFKSISEKFPEQEGNKSSEIFPCQFGFHSYISFISWKLPSSFGTVKRANGIILNSILLCSSKTESRWL